MSQLKEKKLWWEGPNFLKKHNIKLNSHENVSIKFENFDITETLTWLVLRGFYPRWNFHSTLDDF